MRQIWFQTAAPLMSTTVGGCVFVALAFAPTRPPGLGVACMAPTQENCIYSYLYTCTHRKPPPPPPMAHSSRKLLLTGIMYPPAGGAWSLGEQCEEFTVDEIDDVVGSLSGLPVLVEHDSNRLVGIVRAARRTHANAIEVQAEVTASTAAGVSAIQDILDKKLVGLSLSHSYDLDAKAGSDTARNLQVALCEGGDWRDCLPTDSAIVRKRLHELSVCAHPARDGCHIHDVVCASAQRRVIPSVGQQPTESINTTPPTSVQHHLDKSFVAVFDCGDEQAMATPTETPAPPCVAQGDTQTPIPDATTPEAPVPEGGTLDPESAESIGQPIGSVVAVEEEGAGVADGGVASTEAISTMMDQATQQLKQAHQDLKALRDRQASMQAEAAAAVGAKAAELASERLRTNDLAHKLEEQQRIALLRAQTTKAGAMQDLQKTLLMFHEQGAVVELPPPAPDATEVENLKYETDVATAAIKTLTNSQAKARTMGCEHEQLKRQHTALGNAVSSFGGANKSRAGMVCASAGGGDVPPAKKTRADTSLIEWRSLNPHACAREVQAAKASLQKPSQIRGVVSASVLGRPWSSTSLSGGDVEPASSVSAFDLHPDLAKEYLRLNSGCMPSAEATSAIMKSISHTPVDRRY